ADKLKDLGYIIALYGSVLIQGVGQDLDLIAVPKVRVPGISPLHVALLLYNVLIGGEWKVRDARNGSLHGFVFVTRGVHMDTLSGPDRPVWFGRRLVDLS